MVKLIWKFGIVGIILTACSSNNAYNNLPLTSSSSSSSSSSSNNTNTNNNNNTLNKTFAGVATKFIVNPNQKSLTLNEQTMNLSGSESSTVVIDGHTVNLNSSTGTIDNINSGQVINDQYSYMHFGSFFTKKDDTTYSYNMVYGQLTPNDNIPSTGIANYKGYAVYRSNPETFATNNVHGLSEFTVNYGDKEINGIIDRKFNVSGQISGNSFSGEKDNIKMQGHFFGPNAQELGGTFNHTNNDITGSFGAQKEIQ